jgi:antitoxin ParD1/3/4
MSIEVSPELEAIVQRELATGEYQSETDVVLRAVKLLEQLRLHSLRKQVQVGLNELDHGEAIELSDREGLRVFFDDIIARGRERRHSIGDGS